MDEIVCTTMSTLEERQRRIDSIRHRKFDEWNALVEKTTRKIKKVGGIPSSSMKVAATASQNVLKRVVITPAVTAAGLLSPRRTSRRRIRRYSMDTAGEVDDGHSLGTVPVDNYEVSPNVAIGYQSQDEETRSWEKLGRRQEMTMCDLNEKIHHHLGVESTEGRIFLHHHTHPLNNNRITTLDHRKKQNIRWEEFC
jgi:hypothetical protein